MDTYGDIESQEDAQSPGTMERFPVISFQGDVVVVVVALQGKSIRHHLCFILPTEVSRFEASDHWRDRDSGF